MEENKMGEGVSGQPRFVQEQAKENMEKELIGDTGGKMSLGEDNLIKERKEKIVKFFKTRYNWITYVLLGIIAWISVNIRTRNLPLLKDITTGGWTLGPDLDPFLFLRWAKYIVEHGSLFAVDTMRYVPLGLGTQEEYMLHPYLIAWFHKIAAYFGSESVTHSAVLFPVVMFALTVIAFFFLARKIFVSRLGERRANIIGLLSALFLTVMPVLLPRTIAGIPEKESAAFLFMFLAFYFLLCAWDSKKNVQRYSFALLAGISTAAMAMIWGGFIFIFMGIYPAVFLAFLFGSINKEKVYTYSVWLISSLLLMHYLSTRYHWDDLFSSMATMPALGVLFVIIVNEAIFNTKLKEYFKSGRLSRIPPKIISTIISGFILIIGTSIIFGLGFIPSQISYITSQLISPATSRLIQTVAENKQPFFTEWASSFGPYIKQIPVFFWLFFVGSIYLFYKMASALGKKERIILTASYFVFLAGIIFSRYSGSSTLNGTNFTSTLFYAFGFIVFLFSAGFYYYKYWKEGKEERLKEINFSWVLLFVLFTLCIVAARAAVRTVMMLVPPTAIIVSYFVVASFGDARKVKEDVLKIGVWILVGIIILATVFSAYKFYEQSNGEAAMYGPNVYTQQWQKAMAWVRENTETNAVFGHWWDYGYWIQSIGERATVLDGGNAISYWNHLMGRHGLTSPNSTDALEFLYAHNTTHFLIDSTDIGKYAAFSSIGSDATYDRRSWIPTFLRDNNQIKETKNSTITVYTGGSSLDGDLIYEENGTRIFLPGGNAGIGAVLIEKEASGNLKKQPEGIFVYQDKQYNLPLRYAFSNGKFLDFGSGAEAGVFIFPRVTETSIEPDGALLYLSDRTVKSQLARLYLYKENDPNFKLVYSEDDYVVEQVKKQNPQIGDIIFFNGIRGPIRIWEIEYPKDIKFKQEYLNKEYPKELYYA